MTARWSIVVPVKGGSAGKSRLTVPAQARRALAYAFARDTLAAACAAHATDTVTVVTSDGDVATIARGLGAVVTPDLGGDLNGALECALSSMDLDRPRAILLGDLPSLTPHELDQALAEALDLDAAMVADHTGEGTTLLTAAPGRALVPRFGPGSAAAHISLGHVPLKDVGGGLRWDVDGISDLANVAAAVGPATASVLSQHRDLLR